MNRIALRCLCGLQKSESVLPCLSVLGYSGFSGGVEVHFPTAVTVQCRELLIAAVFQACRGS